MEIAALISLLLPVLTAGLQTAGVLPGNYSQLISTSIAPIITLVNTLIGQGTITDKELAALNAVSAEIEALKKANIATFTLNQANEINALEAAIAAAITAYQKSRVITDPSNLTPLQTNLG